MAEPRKGPTPEVGEKLTPQDADQNRPSGSDQQHTPRDPHPSVGVTQGHHSPQQPKHGRSGEAESRSSTGLPQSEDSRNPGSDHNPRTEEAGGGSTGSRNG